MKCDQFRDALRAQHAWDRPDDELPAGLRQHASGCEACSDEWDRVRRLDAALSGLARESSPGAPPALEGRLLEAFRAHHRQVMPVGAQSGSALTWLPLAAGVVLAVGASWWFVGRPVQSSATHAQHAPQASQAVVSAAPSAAAYVPRPEVTSRTAPNPERRAAIDEQRAARLMKSSAPTLTPESPSPVGRDPDAVLADFVTLPYGAMPTDDDVHIVEIDVPRDSLYDFGSAAQPGAPTNDLVTADVLIGDDGAPRAFRIVEPTAPTVALDRQQTPLGARSPKP